ncbi:histamine N-methyltransferase A-like isoform X1 [Lissotriton helveticus]
MASSPRSFASDEVHYAQAFQVYLDKSTEHMCMQEFISKDFPKIISGTGQGKSSINVLGIGSGTGEKDIQLLSKLQAQCPGVQVNAHVVEPSSVRLSKYQELVTKTSHLGNIHFTWNEMTVEEYQSEMEDKKEQIKYDFIHMIQVLYYVKDIKKTINYFRNCLAPGGNLLIILISGNSGPATLWKNYGQFYPKDYTISTCTSWDVKTILDEQKVNFEYYHLPSEIDISECFVQGSRDGELLLDFITRTIDFYKVAPYDRVVKLLDILKQQDCSDEKDGKILFKNHNEAIVIPQ